MVDSPRCDNEYGSETAKKKQARLINLVRILIATWTGRRSIHTRVFVDERLRYGPSGTAIRTERGRTRDFFQIYS